MSAYSDIEAADLLNMLATQPLLLVDVRNADEMAKGIIPSAIHIPLAMLPVQHEALTKVENVAFYCRTGIRSTHAAAFLASKGCKNVYNLIGGTLAWEMAGHALVQNNEDKS